MTTTTPTTTEPKSGKIGVNIGYAEGVTCPQCRETHDVKWQYFSVTIDGVSLCSDCLDRLADDEANAPEFAAFAGVVEKLDELDTEMFTADNDGKADPLVMANICMLVTKAAEHLSDRWMPKIDI